MLDVATVLLGLVFGGPAMAAEAQDCAAIKDDPLRLLCYDAAAKNKTGAVTTPEPPGAEPPTATTKDMVAPIAPSDYKVADPEDLHVAPRKFLGKPVEVRHAHCYYADVSDYRCMTPGFASVVVFGPAVEPDDERKRLEDDCGAMKNLQSPRCERTLHFVLDDFGQDTTDFNRARVILRPKTIIIVAAAPAKKRR